ncbi:MAG: HRDC domain-containing protein [Thiotrichaceae bacterium]
MKYRFFTIPVLSPELEQQALNQFCMQQRIVSVDREFVSQGDQSTWAFCLSYIEGAAVSSEFSKKQRKERIDYKEILNEDDFAKYVELRELRKQLAEKHGIPVYAVFTNEQMANMVQQTASTLEALKSIDGVGHARIEKYGEVFLKRLLEWFDETSTH